MFMFTKEFMGLFLCVNIISLVIQAGFTISRYEAKGVSLISFIGMLLIQLLVLYNLIVLNNYLLIMVSILFNSLYLFSGQAFYAGVVPEYITHIDKDISALKAI